MRVLCLGFSVTDLKGYAAELGREMADCEIVSVGIGGIDIQPLPPIFSEVTDQHGVFDLVVLEIFTSLFAKSQPVSANKTIEILHDLLFRIQATGAKVAFLKLYRDDIDQEGSGFDLAMEGLATRYGIPLLNFGKDVRREHGLDYLRGLLTDAVHLTADGARDVARRAAPWIRQAAQTAQQSVPPPQVTRSKLLPSEDGRMERTGYAFPFSVLNPGETIELDVGDARTVGLAYVAGPQAGAIEITGGGRVLQHQCYDQHCYYSRYAFLQLPSMTGKIGIRQLDTTPDVKLLKGEADTGPRVGRLVGLYVESKQSDGKDAKPPQSRTRPDAGPITVARASAIDRVPRLLLFDYTRIGDHAATGQLKATLFADWPSDRLLQVHGGWRAQVGCSFAGETSETSLADPAALAALTRRIADFEPELILYRPVPNAPFLHQLAMETICAHQVPLVTWIVDDWPASLRLTDLRTALPFEQDVRSLFRQSAGALSIGDGMSRAFAARYGRPFQAFANGVDPSEWPSEPRSPSGDAVCVRYSGGLAENMGLSSLLAVAASIERLAESGPRISLEIGAPASQIDRFRDRFAAFARTSFHATDLPPDEYRRWIAGADILLITYNFDTASKTYIRYSIANKLPECLASGAAVLGVGPRDVATMALLDELGCSVNVFDPDPAALDAALANLATSPDRRAQLAGRAREIAFKRFDIRPIRSDFMSWLAAAMETGNTDPLVRAARRAETSLWSLGEMLLPGPARAVASDRGDTAVSADLQAERRQDLLEKLHTLASSLQGYS